MNKFKVGDVVLCVKGGSVVERGYQYQVTSISPCGWFVRVDGNNSGCLDEYFQLVEPVDELPPAPTSVLYREAVTRTTLSARTRGWDSTIELWSGCRGTSVCLSADDTLRLAHDLNRMAMAIKKKDKQNGC